MHVMLPESLRQSRGPGIATPARLLPSDIPPHLRPLSGRALARAPVGGGFPAPPFGCEVGSQFHHRPRFQPPSLKFRTSGFPTVRLQASGTPQFGQKPSASPLEVKANPAMPPSRPAFTPAFGCVRHRQALRLDGRGLGFNAATCALRSSLRMGYVVPPLIAWRPHPPV